MNLDPDVAALLERVRRQRKAKLRAIVNEALRKGLALMTTPIRRRSVHQTAGVDLGRCLVGNLDDVAEALNLSEGDSFR